jgi:hypothetical protein
MTARVPSFVHDGTIIAIGNVHDDASGGNGFAVVRLTSSGALDPSFGVGGRSILSVVDGGGTH